MTKKWSLVTLLFFFLSQALYANLSSQWEGEWDIGKKNGDGLTITNCSLSPVLRCETKLHFYKSETTLATSKQGNLMIPIKDISGKTVCTIAMSLLGDGEAQLSFDGSNCSYSGFQKGSFKTKRLSKEFFLYKDHRRSACYSGHRASPHWCTNKAVYTLAQQLKAYEDTLSRYYELQRERKDPLGWERSAQEKAFKKEQEDWLAKTLKDCSIGSESNIIACLKKSCEQRRQNRQALLDTSLDTKYLAQSVKKSDLFKTLYPQGDFYSRATGWQCKLSEYATRRRYDNLERADVFDVKELKSLPGHLILLRLNRCGGSAQAFFSIWKKDDSINGYSLLDEVRIKGLAHYDNPYELSVSGSGHNRAYLDFTEFSISSTEKAFGFRNYTSTGGSGLYDQREFLNLFRLEEGRLVPIFSETFLQDYRGICMDDDCDSFKSILMISDKIKEGHYEWTVKRRYSKSEENISQVVQRFQWNGKKFALSSEEKYYREEKSKKSL